MTAERPALAHLRADAAYPDYLPCPHCGEPEVEVWSYEKTARCHNCARTFEAQPAPQSQAAGGDLNFKLQNSNVLIVLLSLAILLAACGQPYTFHGTLLEPPSPAADFALTDQNGAAFRLSEQTGKVVLMYFGYTNCPDVCPATLTQLKRLKAELGQEAERVVFALVTVDPERDTPERLKEYLSQFDPSFVGLTGSLADLEPVWKSYGVYREKQTGESAAGYLMDHTARIYAVDARGNLRLTYTIDTDTNDLTQDVRYLTEEK